MEVVKIAGVSAIRDGRQCDPANQRFSRPWKRIKNKGKTGGSAYMTHKLLKDTKIG